MLALYSSAWGLNFILKEREAIERLSERMTRNHHPLPSCLLSTCQSSSSLLRNSQTKFSTPSWCLPVRQPPSHVTMSACPYDLEQPEAGNMCYSSFFSHCPHYWYTLGAQ